MKAIGLIGVGRMGHGIAANVLKAGFPLTILDHPGNQPVADLVAAGAQPATTPAEVAAASDAVILCVTGAPEVRAVLTGPEGVLAGLTPGATVIDCSTSLPEVSRDLADLVMAQGGRFLDAPMTRTPKEAEAGRLNLIVGGDAALLAEHRSLLESFAENIAHAGGIGTGHALKLLHNFVSLGFTAIASEAVAAASRVGVDRSVLLQVLDTGGGRSVVLDRMKPYLTAGDGSSFNFSISNCAKDTGYFRDMLAALGRSPGLVTALAGLYAGLEAAGRGGETVAALPDMI